MAKVATVVIAGTLADPWVISPVFYWRLVQLLKRMAEDCEDVYVKGIPHCGRRSVPTAVEPLRQWITHRIGDRPTRLIGHSQGGLLAAELALALPQVEEAVVIEPPFRGSPLAQPHRLSAVPVPGVVRSTMGHLVPALLDMAPGSAYLQDLEQRLATIAPKLVTVAYCNSRLVLPDSVYVPGATNYLVGKPSELERALVTGRDVIPVSHDDWWSSGHILGVFRIPRHIVAQLHLPADLERPLHLPPLAS